LEVRKRLSQTSQHWAAGAYLNLIRIQWDPDLVLLSYCPTHSFTSINLSLLIRQKYHFHGHNGLSSLVMQVDRPFGGTTAAPSKRYGLN
jgi:hypothetical protein